MADNPQDMDLEQRRKLLEERRRMLEQRRQEISRSRSATEGPEPPKPAEISPERPRPAPSSAPSPTQAKPDVGRDERPKTVAPPPSREPSPEAPPKTTAQLAGKAASKSPERAPERPAPKAPEKPAPKAPEKPAPKAPEKPASKAPERPASKAPERPEPKPAEKPAPKAQEKPPAPARPEIARAAAPPKRSPLPVIIAGVVVVAAVVIGLVVTTSGKKAGETAELEQARADSLRLTQKVQAREDSSKRAAEQQTSSVVDELRGRLAEAERLQAASRAKSDYDQASDYLDEAVQLSSQGNLELATQRARIGIEHIDSAIDRSRRIQEREDLSKRDRDQALARLLGEVNALAESVNVLKADGGSSFSAAQVQQLEQIVQKARQFTEAGNLNGGQEQVSYAFDMASKVRFAISDGRRQQAEAERMLAERRIKAVEDSVRRVQASAAQLALPPTPAKATKTVSPVYPPAARMAGIAGTVEVEFEVGTDGRARDFKVVKSLGGGCDESAVDAIKQWEFTPATQGGKPVPTRMKIPIVFRKS